MHGKLEPQSVFLLEKKTKMINGDGVQRIPLLLTDSGSLM